MIEVGRKGMYAGNVYVFTCRDPKSGNVWSDDIPNGPKIPDGRWVDADSVHWEDNDGKDQV